MKIICNSTTHEISNDPRSLQFYKDKSKKNGYDSVCKLCRNKIRNKVRSNNAEKYRNFQQKYLDGGGGKEVVLKYNRNYYQQSSFKIKECTAKWIREHPVQRKAQARICSAQRREQIKIATPNWCDNDRIREIYLEAITTQIQTKVEHHVDHIVPLNGKSVCGLHCEDNLQILTANDNLQKGNRFDEV